jgi:phospholipid/cholesterol/gamma-HCH transport system substrate-binding protein
VRNFTVIGRAAALGAIVIVIVAVALIVFTGGSGYKVKAIFQNASQIVNGDQVQVAGNSIGTVSNIAVTPNGQAELTLAIDDSRYKPLRRGTTATVREASLTGIANRYVDLQLGPGTAPEIPSGGVIGTTHTTSEVDLDQLLNTLNTSTRKGIQDVFQGSAAQYGGQGANAALAWQYLNPAVVSTSELFSELGRDTANFKNFIVKSGNLLTDTAARQSDLSGLVVHLASTTQALASQSAALGQSIQRLPGFMRLANTTFVNLRRALDDLTPLVNVSKPVAPKLQRLLAQLKPLAEESVPTVQALANIIRRPGNNNDLIELTQLSVPLAAVTVHPVHANGARRPGAFPQSVIALNDSTPELATARPYAVDLTGWFDGFSHPGVQDAAGGTNRIAGLLGAPNLATAVATGGVVAGQGDRCPGSMERGAIWYPEPGFPCNPKQVPTGP